MPGCTTSLAADAALDAGTLERLRAYAELLGRWTRRINLVSAADREVIWERHVLDSLRLVRLVPAGTARAIDLGSGGGLPGLVLAIATGVEFDLVESDRRKAAFLAEAARRTGAPVRVHAVRIESCGLAPAGLVTARAVAPLAGLLGLAAPLLAPGGVLLAPKGVRAEEEIAAARAGWSFDVRVEGGAVHPVLAVQNPRVRSDA